MAKKVIANSYIVAIENYRTNGSEDECFFAKLTDGLLDGCESHDAYEAIDAIVEHALDENDEGLYYDHLQFILRLGRKVDTSQAPESLINNVAKLEKMASNFGQPQLSSLKEICAWFMLPFSKRVN
jgi:hypothetical protein